MQRRNSLSNGGYRASVQRLGTRLITYLNLVLSQNSDALTLAALSRGGTQPVYPPFQER